MSYIDITTGDNVKVTHGATNIVVNVEKVSGHHFEASYFDLQLHLHKVSLWRTNVTENLGSGRDSIN